MKASLVGLALSLSSALLLPACRGPGCCGDEAPSGPAVEPGAGVRHHPAFEGSWRSSTSPGDAMYRCPMDGATRSTPGPCPVCGMRLDESHRVAPR